MALRLRRADGSALGEDRPDGLAPKAGRGAPHDDEQYTDERGESSEHASKLCRECDARVRIR